MRLFIAIVPPDGALAELEQAVAPIRSAWPGLRWAGPEAWHLTLAFLGEVDPGRLSELTARLERAAHRHGQLTLEIRDVGAFPGPRRARVLWAGIAGDVHELGRLAQSAAAAARRAGAPPPDEGRRFRPHLTLARCRTTADVRPITEALAGFGGSQWTAAAVHLIRSHLGPNPSYETLGSWPLRLPGH